MDFGKRAVALERCIEHVEGAITPAAFRGGAKQGIASLAGDAPYFAGEFLARKSVDGVEQFEIAGRPLRAVHQV